MTRHFTSSYTYLICATSGIVDPEPTADAFAIWARGKSGNIESLKLARNAIVDYREDYEVVWCNLALFGFVRNSKGASSHVIILQ